MSDHQTGCHDIPELLGAYALDAVDPDERAAVEAHLTSCPRCAQEVAEHREAIGLLAASGGDAPDGVWERISQSIDGGRPDVARLPRLLPPDRRSRRRTATPARALAIAAAVAAGVLVGVQTMRVDHLDHQVARLNAAAREAGGFQGAAAALVDPSARRLTLTSTAPGSRPLGEMVVLPSGSAYLVGVNLPALASSSTYQLWSVIAGRAVSVGLLGNHPGTVAFSIDPGVGNQVLLVTVEPAGGVVAPTTPPVARAAI